MSGIPWDCVNLQGRPLQPPDDGTGYVFPTWEDALGDAQKAISHAYEARRRTMQAAYNAGLTMRSIAEATGLSAAGVSKIIGPQKAKDQAAKLREVGG